MAVCGSCDAPVLWVKTEGGRAMPLDRDPVPGGNIEMIGDALVAVRGRGYDWPPGAVRYRSHFVSCPHASRHRRAR